MNIYAPALSAVLLSSSKFLAAASNNEGNQRPLRGSTNTGKPCMKVTLTGTMPGPGVFNGLAASGTLVTYGTNEDSCSQFKFLFDIGRGTTTRLSELGIRPTDIDALFLTHLHTDHVGDLSIFMNYRWMFNGKGGDNPVDIICSDPSVQVGPAPIFNCTALVEHIGDPDAASGELATRRLERNWINSGGPSALGNVITFIPSEEPEIVYEHDPISIEAIRSKHVNGHASYRMKTPAGDVVIAGDASNDEADPDARPYSTSDNVEKLAHNAAVLVHSAIHPIMKDSGFPAKVYNRQSTAPDIAAMAERAKVDKVMLTHMMPPVGADAPFIFKVPGGPLTEEDWLSSVEQGGFSGEIYIGTDLLAIEIEQGPSSTIE